MLPAGNDTCGTSSTLFSWTRWVIGTYGSTATAWISESAATGRSKTSSTRRPSSDSGVSCTAKAAVMTGAAPGGIWRQTMTEPATSAKVTVSGTAGASSDQA